MFTVQVGRVLQKAGGLSVRVAPEERERGGMLSKRLGENQRFIAQRQQQTNLGVTNAVLVPPSTPNQVGTCGG